MSVRLVTVIVALEKAVIMVVATVVTDVMIMVMLVVGGLSNDRLWRWYWQ